MSELHHHLFLNLGKQSFPVPGQASFPLNALVARYTLNLLPVSPVHVEFLRLITDVIGLDRLGQITADLFSGNITESQLEVLTGAGNQEDIYPMVVGLIQRVATDRRQRVFRDRLAFAVRTHLPALPGENSAYGRRVQHLQQLIGLSPADVCVLECMICRQVSRSFEMYCAEYPSLDWCSVFATALGLDYFSLRGRLVNGGSLAAKGLVEVNTYTMGASKAVFEYLAGLSEELLSRDEVALAGTSQFPLSSFPVAKKDVEVLLHTLRNSASCHLFFYGRPGTGKTEMAKALAAEAGKAAYLVKYGDDGHETDRRRAITVSMNMAPKNSVVIIDEADRILNTAALLTRKMVDKGWINNFMDECKHKVIWIANESDSIETSVLRRFSYSLEFKKFTADQRERAWKTQLKQSSLSKVIPPAMMSRLVCNYETDAGGIASVLKSAEGIFADSRPSAAEIEETLGRLLLHHEKLSGLGRKKKKLNRLSQNYDVDALHTDFPAAELMAALKSREQKTSGLGNSLPANILFWGLPGTGKTEFAKHIAHELGKSLLVKRMSDLQGMYVGQTEKGIAAAFEEAERDGAVLFLDEADSLILDRNTATRSWEASQTNEVLTQMENFNGICICCTNLLGSLDEAALRRFTWKVKFLPLTDEGKEKLFRKYFQPKGRLSEFVRADLRNIRNLTPGDFKTVSQRQQHFTRKPSAAETVKALKQEASYKRNTSSGPIGFAA
jgi:SpoVK/Ycf46/Vps4 family AAA+-type ATPase